MDDEPDSSYPIQMQLFDLDEDIILLEIQPQEFESLCFFDQCAVGEKFVGLAVAVIKMAVFDAKKGDAEAVDWLKTTGVLWMDDLGIDPAHFLTMVKRLKRRTYRAGTRYKIAEKK